MLTKLKQVNGVKVGCWLTGRQKRKRVDWHHRVPDFRLVYCGPKKSTPIKEEKNVHEERMINISNEINKTFKKKEQIEKALK